MNEDKNDDGSSSGLVKASELLPKVPLQTPAETHSNG